MAWAPNPGTYRMDLRFLSLTTRNWLVADTSKLNGSAAGCCGERYHPGVLQNLVLPRFA
jgi:hypothetical protein